MTTQKETLALEILAAGGRFVVRVEDGHLRTRLIRSLERTSDVVDGFGFATLDQLRMRGLVEYRREEGFSRADYWALKGGA